MKMRKIIPALAAAAVSVSVLSTAASAEDYYFVSVIISDGAGNVNTADIYAEDYDGDGAITINDALYGAHELAFDGGAKKGYASEETEYGLSLTKLWGIENGGAYGYYVNNTSALSLADPVNIGDTVNAFVYSDTENFSDVYCFFDIGEAPYYIPNYTGTVELTLNAASYDENWNPITVPVEGAEITVDGKKTGIFTDENGKAALELSPMASWTVSAVSDTQTLVPPHCEIIPMVPCVEDVEDNVLSFDDLEDVDDDFAVDAADGKDTDADDGAVPPTGVSLALIAPAMFALAVLALRKRDA